MKKLLYFFLVLIPICSCENQQKTESIVIEKISEQAEFSIVIHGGAGTIKRENMSAEKEAAYRQKLEEAIQVGYTILKKRRYKFRCGRKNHYYFRRLSAF